MGNRHNYFKMYNKKMLKFSQKQKKTLRYTFRRYK